MAVEAQTRAIVARTSSRTTLRQMFLPLGQLLLFVVGSAAVLCLLVVLLGLLLGPLTGQPKLLNGVLAILPIVVIDGLVVGFLYATIALGYTMVYGVLEFINFAHGEIFMVGAFVGGELALFMVSHGLLRSIPPLLFVVLAVLLGMVVSGILAMSVERV